MPASLPLTALHGRYRIDRELGHGGMATVFLAHDLKHDRPVALKLMRPEAAAGLGADRFRREIATAARLQHPHICSVIDSGEADGRLWFTMPYVRGESLRDRLRRLGRLSVPEALRITREVAQALGYAHREGVIHRDVKPENILLTEDGVTLLADFGIARPVTPITGEHLTEAGHGLGTPMYMSPEQAMAEPADHRADQYALAATCYEMLAGRPPHLGPTAHAVIALRFSTPPAGIRALRPGTPEAVELALRRALSIRRSERFESIAAFAAALTDASATRPAGRGTRPRRRVPRAAWIALATLSTILASALAIRRGGTAPDAPVAIAEPTRLAVLPFENLGDSADAFLTEGMADEVRAKLAGLPGLEVIARGSSNQYRATGQTPAQIADELGVRYLLTGTVRWEKGLRRSRVRVSPELIEARTGVTRWTHPFNAAFTDVFGVQADIAGRVAEALHLALTDSTRARLAASPTTSLEAYARWLRSRELRAGDASPEALRGAIAELQQAVALDSGFVAAWADLALVQVDAFRLGGMAISDAETAHATLRRAVALAPASPDVRAASGRYKLNIDGDFVGALAEYRQGLRVAPNRSDLLAGAAVAELELGRRNEAVADLRHAASLDPRSPDVASSLGGAYLRLRRYPEARAEIERGRRLRPTSLSLAYVLARIGAAEGDLDAARRPLRELEASAGARGVVAYVALREDLIWTLADDQLRMLTALTPADLDGGRGDWALAVAEAHHFLGDSAQARAYGDSAASAYAELLAGWGRRKDRGQVVVTRALALALAGRTGEALREAERAGVLQPLGSGLQSAYVAYVQGRVFAMAGERARAVERLTAVLAVPAQVSRGSFRIDRTLAALRDDAAFQSLITER
ncbi:MAG TPA: protein kinase [Gemmatimonadales bacterium]|nr:protein kinase [Gemmatimonadales bacterium]